MVKIIVARTVLLVVFLTLVNGTLLRADPSSRTNDTIRYDSSNRPPEQSRRSSEEVSNLAVRGVSWSTSDVLSCVILGFGVVVLLIEFFLLRSVGALPADVVQALIVTVIVVGALFTITAGYTPQQIAPATGLFGTIAGYLLGRRSGHSSKE